MPRTLRRKLKNILKIVNSVFTIIMLVGSLMVGILTIILAFETKNWLAFWLLITVIAALITRILYEAL